MSSKGEKYFGKLFLIVGPSGSGKGTVINRFKKKYPGFVYPVSYTTRKPRKNEVDGEVYHFVSKEKFKEMIRNDELLEYAIVHSDNYYGTSKKGILEPLIKGAVVMREVDIQGFHSIKDLIPNENLVSIFVKVSGLDDLKRRILKRGKMTEEELDQRMKSALEEIVQADQCDYQVENKWNKIDECVRNIEEIVLKEIEDLY
ncbi:guanylate kinase [Candidatus Peregrinibacteria bacterium]|nr:guanylate kinase [Candidatus Peregrinibacteria bacterium]